jgi:hypothetical protein
MVLSRPILMIYMVKKPNTFVFFVTQEQPLSRTGNLFPRGALQEVARRRADFNDAFNVHLSSCFENNANLDLFPVKLLALSE